jgi:hypothetical protein
LFKGFSRIAPAADANGKPVEQSTLKRRTTYRQPSVKRSSQTASFGYAPDSSTSRSPGLVRASTIACAPP